MNLAELIRAFDPRVVHGPGDAPIADLTDDSRAVHGGSSGVLFVARPAGGSPKDLLAALGYARDAVSRGAVAVLGDGRLPIQAWAGLAEAAPPGSPVTVAVAPTIDQSFCGRLAERFFGHPARRLRLIGVTGTNGKTTTTLLIQHFLAAVGIKAGLIGTVWIDDGIKRTAAELTTPGAIELSRLLARMIAGGCTAAVMETSSHALEQGRTAALDFAVAVFTNLTGDHLDYHKTMADYAAAKAVLFERLGPEAWAVANLDDPYARRMLRDCRAQGIGCRLDAPRSISPTAPLPGAGDAGDTEGRRLRLSCHASVLSLGPSSTRARFNGPWGEVEVDLPLVGRHNVENALHALAATAAIADLSRAARQALQTAPTPPGRLEPVRPRMEHGPSSDAPAPAAPAAPAASAVPSVLVDYAHTHDALENVLTALRPVVPPGGRLIVLFGCGGDRDRTKRPKMAAVACRLADVVLLTSDNPRTEDPHAILDQVLGGVPKGLPIWDCRWPNAATDLPGSTASSDGPSAIVQPDRAAAIGMAIGMARPGDVVLLAGKGHEDYQIIGREKRHFDDREQAAEALRRWASEHLPGPPGRPLGR